jgi:hypothetical protein
MRMAFDGDDEVQVGGAKNGDVEHVSERRGLGSVLRQRTPGQRPELGLRARSGCGSGAHAYGRNEPEAGGVALVFGFPTPEAVFVLFTGKNHAVSSHGAARTHVFRGGFAPLSCLWPLGRRREKQMCEAFAGSITHPLVYSLDLFIEIDNGHSDAP